MIQIRSSDRIPSIRRRTPIPGLGPDPLVTEARRGDTIIDNRGAVTRTGGNGLLIGAVIVVLAVVAFYIFGPSSNDTASPATRPATTEPAPQRPSLRRPRRTQWRPPHQRTRPRLRRMQRHPPKTRLPRPNRHLRPPTLHPRAGSGARPRSGAVIRGSGSPRREMARFGAISFVRKSSSGAVAGRACQMWIGLKKVASAASLTASDMVGCAWQVRADPRTNRRTPSTPPPRGSSRRRRSRRCARRARGRSSCRPGSSRSRRCAAWRGRAPLAVNGNLPTL